MANKQEKTHMPLGRDAYRFGEGYWRRRGNFEAANAQRELADAWDKGYLSSDRLYSPEYMWMLCGMTGRNP